MALRSMGLQMFAICIACLDAILPLAWCDELCAWLSLIVVREPFSFRLDRLWREKQLENIPASTAFPITVSSCLIDEGLFQDRTGVSVLRRIWRQGGVCGCALTSEMSCRINRGIARSGA